VLWVFTAGGRIGGRPLLHGGLCYFGAHDGYVYAVDEDSGKLIWRFQAEPYARRVVAYGQVESSWPIYGVVLNQGAVCASAGRHPELGGGIHVWGLRPTDGRPVWHKVITKRQYSYGGNRPRNVRIRPNVLLNAPLQSDGEALILPGLRFNPDDSDEAIEERLEAERKRR
jgi:outer membrane protein assembly factor BamB